MRMNSRAIRAPAARGPAQPGPTALTLPRERRAYPLRRSVPGRTAFRLAACGDVVVERRDGIASYQLAVVVDDAFQRVTRVVRGADLLPSTPWQIDLQRALALPQPSYGHLPLLVEPDGAKLSKSRRALPVDLIRRPTLTDIDPYAFVAGPTPRTGRHSLLKRCGNGHLRTGTRKRLRARPRSRCPPEATDKQNSARKIVGCTEVY